MKKFLPILLMLSGCSTWLDNAKGPSLTEKGQLVKVLENPPPTCQLLGEVIGEDWWIGLRRFSIIKARNAAGEKGANALVVTKIGHSQKHTIWANIYKCSNI